MARAAPQSIFDDDPDSSIDRAIELIEADIDHEMMIDDLESEGVDQGVDEETDLLPIQDDHYANLVPIIHEDGNAGELDLIATEALDKIEQDIQSRSDWAAKIQRRYEALGLIESGMDDGPFEGSSTAVHQGLLDSCVRWTAGILSVLIPPDGPAKVKAVGDNPDEEQLDRAGRVERHENASMMYMDDRFIPEIERSAAVIPIEGSCFVSSYRDVSADVTRSEFISSEDVIVPYRTTSLQAAPHFAVRIHKTPNEVKRLMASGFYHQIDLPEPSEEADEEGETAHDAVEGVSQAEDRVDTYEIFQFRCNLNLKGFEDKDSQGNETGIDLPYCVTIEKENRKVLRICREWDEDDDLKQRKARLRKLGFFPGFRFYDLGLFDMAGLMSWAATGALRLILDGSAAASIPGGFKAKNGNFSEDRLEYEPGVWLDVDCSFEDLQKTFFTPPVKEPSPALFNAFQLLDEAIKRTGSSTDLLTGNTDGKQPVGTTVALLEEANKIIRATHYHMMMAFAGVLQDRYEINRMYTPAEGYNYSNEVSDAQFADDDAFVKEEDYAPDLKIALAADPNNASSTERILKAQATYQISQENPDLMDRHVVVKRLLEAMQVPDVDEVMPDPSEISERDPVSEMQAMLMGKPIKAFPNQDHQAHIAVHMAFAQNPGYGGNPQVQEALGMQFQAHLAEHLAYLAAQQIAGMGVQGVQYFDPEEELPLAPAMSNMIAQQAAMVSQQIAQMSGLPAAPDPSQQKVEQNEQLHQQKLQHTQESHDQKMEQEAEKAGMAAGTSTQKAIQSRQDSESKREQKVRDAELDRDLKEAREVSEILSPRPAENAPSK